MAVRVYKSIAPPPMVRGPLGVMQYTWIVAAETKAAAAAIANLRPAEMEWERDPSWIVHKALLEAGYLQSPGEAFLTGATRGDHLAIWKAVQGGWEYLGRVEYRGPGLNNPYLEDREAER